MATQQENKCSDDQDVWPTMDRTQSTTRGKLKALLTRATKPVVGRKASAPTGTQQTKLAPSFARPYDQNPSSALDRPVRESQVPAFRIHIDDLRRSESSSTIDLGAIPTPADW